MSQQFKCPSRRKSKTLCCKTMKFLKFSAIINGHKTLCEILCQFLFSLIRFSVSTNLTIFLVVTIYRLLQEAVLIFLSNWQNLMVLVRSLFSFIKPSENPQPLHPHYFTKKKLIKNISFHYNVTVHLRMYAPLLQLGVIWPKTWASTQPHIVFSTLKCRLFLCFKQKTHCTEQSYIAQASMCCAQFLVFLVGWQMGLVFLVLWSEVEPCSHLQHQTPHQCKSEMLV